MSATTLRVAQDCAGSRLDVWLASASGLVRAEVQRLIAAGLVTVDGGGASKSLRLAGGEVVRISHPSSQDPPVEKPDVPIRYEDRHLAVVAKPAGLVVHAAPGSSGPSLVDALSGRISLAAASGPQRPGIVHRLDKGTSGLLVVAKTDEAYHALVQAMKRRQVRRSYLALVTGVPSMPRGRIEAPLGRSPRNPLTVAVMPEGRPSVTEFKVLEAMKQVSLLEVSLLTGRTHQIRVHLAHIHHPVVGDLAYGGSARQAAALGLTRPFLHAAELRFDHPAGGEQVHVKEALPADLREALEAARRISSSG